MTVEEDAGLVGPSEINSATCPSLEIGTQKAPINDWSSPEDPLIGVKQTRDSEVVVEKESTQ